MNHLEDRLREENVDETAIKEILQYVKHLLDSEYEDGYTDGYVVYDAENEVLKR